MQSTHQKTPRATTHLTFFSYWITRSRLCVNAKAEESDLMYGRNLLTTKVSHSSCSLSSSTPRHGNFNPYILNRQKLTPDSFFSLFSYVAIKGVSMSCLLRFPNQSHIHSVAHESAPTSSNVVSSSALPISVVNSFFFVQKDQAVVGTIFVSFVF